MIFTKRKKYGGSNGNNKIMRNSILLYRMKNACEIIKLRSYYDFSTYYLVDGETLDE